MQPRSLQFIGAACAAEILSGSEETRARRICTDSRHAQAGDIFFALNGERFDGHDFIEDAVSKGAVAVVIERGRAAEVLALLNSKSQIAHSQSPITNNQSQIADSKSPAANGKSKNGGMGASPLCPVAVLAVEDTRKALGRFAAEYRKDFAMPIVAIAGSNGKTTTKELVASVLRQKQATLWSEASFNNDIGVPLTLLRLENKHQAAVFEVGTNHPGELAPLVKMIQPNYGIVTTIGREHLEHFHTVEGVAEEEGWLGELLPADGKLFINGDNEWAKYLASRTRAMVVRIGFNEGNDLRIRELRHDKRGVTFRVEAPGEEFSGEYRVNLMGRHQAVNGVFALAIGVELGLSRGEIEKGLAACKPAKMRLQLWEHKGVRVLDDAYNANADSMLAALQTLQDLPCKGRRIAVLGDMAELGAHSEAAHEEVGRRAAELGIGQLFAIGKMAAVLARGARAGGLNRVMEFPDVESASAPVKHFLKSGDLMLIKASRAARLERIADLLRAGEELARRPQLAAVTG